MNKHIRHFSETKFLACGDNLETESDIESISSSEFRRDSYDYKDRIPFIEKAINHSTFEGKSILSKDMWNLKYGIRNEEEKEAMRLFTNYIAERLKPSYEISKTDNNPSEFINSYLEERREHLSRAWTLYLDKLKEKLVSHKPYCNFETPHVAAYFSQQYAIKERRAWLVAKQELHKRTNQYYETLGTFLTDDTIARQAAGDRHLEKVLKIKYPHSVFLKRMNKTTVRNDWTFQKFQLSLKIKKYLFFF